VPLRNCSLTLCVSGDRRLNKPGNYNCESSYGRNYAPAEPEWYTEGPISQSDTIELHGFDTAHGKWPRTQNDSDSDASHDGQKVPTGRRDRDGGRGGKPGTVKNKDKSSRSRGSVESSAAASNSVLNDECQEQNDLGAFVIVLS